MDDSDRKLIIDIQYRIAQNGGGVKLWRTVNFKNLAGKTEFNLKCSHDGGA